MSCDEIQWNQTKIVQRLRRNDISSTKKGTRLWTRPKQETYKSVRQIENLWRRFWCKSAWRFHPKYNVILIEIFFWFFSGDWAEFPSNFPAFKTFFLSILEYRLFYVTLLGLNLFSIAERPFKSGAIIFTVFWISPQSVSKYSRQDIENLSVFSEYLWISEVSREILRKFHDFFWVSLPFI